MQSSPHGDMEPKFIALNYKAEAYINIPTFSSSAQIAGSFIFHPYKTVSNL